MSLEDHAEELASDLGVDKEEVTRDLENLVNYSVPMDEAKQSLRRKYGDGSSGGDNTPSSKAINEVSTDDSNVTVTAVVLTSGRRSIQYNGEQHVIREGELADETGKISYTAWDGFSGDLQPGQTVRLGNAGVREWDGQPELNLGDSTDPEVVDETLDIDYEVGGRAALQDLAPGDRGITVEVQVLECEQKVIDGRDGETTILSGVLGDESGRLPFTDWEPHAEIEEGASVRLEETFVREFRGAPSVNVSEFSTVTALDRTVEVAEDAPRLSIREAVESGGLFDVELAGNVIEVRDGSGLIERCPECGRVIQNGQCRSHGAVEGEDDLRTKAILDDGTATVTAVLDDELTARVYGGDLDDAREHARDAMDKEVVADRIADRIVGHEFVVRGSLSVDEYGANLTASTFAEADDDPATRARTLLQEADT
ncbi:Single-stranded DNA binding protein [Haloarcula sp. Atlit-47R]|uniref:Single-stranded DNA binding protein n=1 Tax=Haloarcula sp. Atlit-47R TaxID=2282132 RepID=UPI000EF23B37|nr:Single-stranded DNA binding protein [Haloarcula sp. Atlit-47R]RLM42644.1 Single-stranded DNA binding protein [Haloarcula sp. Atlit-47R]